MNNPKKLLISAALVTVLGVQVTSQVVGTGGRFWPFMPYRMYSDIYEEGATISFYEVRVAAGMLGENSRTLTSEDAGLPKYKYAGMLAAAASGQGWLLDARVQGAAASLTAIVAELGSYGTAQLWELRYEIGPEGLRSRQPERTLVREWFVTPTPTVGPR